MNRRVDLESMRFKLVAYCEQMGLSLSDELCGRLIQYAQLVYQWNKSYNLTSVRHFEGLLHRHLVDSLTVLPYIEGGYVLDVGSGAGFPGMPLAMVRDDLKVALLDSNSKRMCFLKQVISDMHLTNVGIVHKRVEEYHPKTQFRYIISRAFSSLSIFLGVIEHLVHDDTVVLAIKGMYPTAELEEINMPYEVYALDLPGDVAQRHLVAIQGSDIRSKNHGV